MPLINTTLSSDFSYEGIEDFKSTVEILDSAVNATGIVNDSAWKKAVAGAAQHGFNLDAWELEVRNLWALPSKRPGGKRGKGTGFLMPVTPKTYKSYMSSAIDNDVELLDGGGFPRSLSDVKNDIAALKPASENSPEAKYLKACEAAMKYRGKLTNLSDALVTAGDEILKGMVACF